MHACMHTYIHTYIHTYTYTYIYIYIHILYIKMNVCMFVPYTNPHFLTDRNQTLHTASPWSGKDRRVYMGPKFWTSSKLLGPFSFGGNRWLPKRRFPQYRYIRGSSWCSCDVTDIRLSLAAESSAAVLKPRF
jgi:hypothetical protein